MRVLVFGAGAIGSFLGHRLVTAGHDVTLIGRAAYVRAAQQRGLILEEQERGKPAVATSIAPLGMGRLKSSLQIISRSAARPCMGVLSIPLRQRASLISPPTSVRWDLILVTVKVYDTAKAAQALAPYLA